MSNHDNAMQIIESRFKLLEAGDTSSVVHAELGMAIEMAHSCGVISLEEYVPFSFPRFGRLQNSPEHPGCVDGHGDKCADECSS